MGRKRKRRREKQQGTTPSKPLTPEIRQLIETWALEAVEVHDLELFDVETAPHGRWIIKVFIDRPGAEAGTGISVGECAEVSRYIETLLDADERVPEKYVIEVSSPGIERPLKKPRHLDQVVGKDVELVLREPIHGRNKIIGHLLRHEDGLLEIEIEDETFEIDWDQVARAKLKFDFSEKSEDR